MPPGPAYNWLCVLNSTAEILQHVALYRASQIAPGVTTRLASRKRRRTENFSTKVNEETRSEVQNAAKTSKNIAGHAFRTPPTSTANRTSPVGDLHDVPVVNETVLLNSRPPQSGLTDRTSINDSVSKTSTTGHYSKSVEIPAQGLTYQTEIPKTPVDASETPQNGMVDTNLIVNRNLQSSKVPSSRLGRLFHYGGLAASLGYGAASELIRRTGSGSNDQPSSSLMMTEANIRRLVSKLSQMRGAALKLGQFMSIQDTHALPPEIDKIFRRVQDSAHYMPDWQMEQVLNAAFSPTWPELFTEFSRLPFAAASIGQVHTATLASSVSPTGRPEAVAIKIQFPNIANSIESDLGYLKVLLTAGSLLPKGLFLDRTIQVMKQELADECNYIREASFLKKFGSTEYLGSDPRFKVPWVWEGSTDTVLVMERVNGISVGEADANLLSRSDRDDIAARIIELCLKELFEFRTMQTDPNWTNFLWNPQTRQIELVDFGATRSYSKEFIDTWLRLLTAAASEDRDACIEWSLKIGYLTGAENQTMLDAHVDSMILLTTPFKPTTAQPFSFGQGSSWADITAQIRANIPVMLQNRLTPPPQETYSLNRKLSGAFLLAARLGATVDTKTIWDKVVGKYEFSS